MRSFGIIVLLALCACTLEAEHTRVDGGTEDLLRDNRGIVLIGLRAEGLAGECNVRVGRSGSGRVTQEITPGWATRDGPVIRGSRVLPAGVWDIYQIGCGREGIHRLDGPLGYSISQNRYKPMASFSVEPGQALYLGDIVLNKLGGFARPEILTDTETARSIMSGIHPDFGRTMQTVPIQ